MRICALIDPSGNEVCRIMADPSVKPYHGHTLVEIPACDIEDERTPLYCVPAWNDGAQPYAENTPASRVLAVTRARIVALQASRGRHDFNPEVNCPAFAWAAKSLLSYDDCSVFVLKIIRDMSAGTFHPTWTLDFVIVNSQLLPTPLFDSLIQALPPNLSRFANRILGKAA